MKRKFLKIIVLLFIIIAASAYLALSFQFFTNKHAISFNPMDYIPVYMEFGFPIHSMVIIAIGIGIFVVVMMSGNSNTFKRDDRNFKYSNSGVYGTAALLNEAGIEGYAKIETPGKAKGTILGQVDTTGRKIINTDLKSRMNKHVAINGASGAGKSRCYARPFIIQCVKRRESVIVTDPKGELYESTAQYLKDNGYIVKIFDLVHPQKSDGWDCLKELRGDELRAQIFSNVVIKNTGNGKSDEFWDNASMSLLKALILRVERGSDFREKGEQHIGNAYELIQNPRGESYLDELFAVGALTKQESVCIGPYMTFKQGSENARGNIITGLATKMQVFQNEIIKKITSVDDIDLTLPAKKPCAYFCIMSDQHTTLNFLSTLFFTYAFIDQVEFADIQPSKRCPVPVNYLLDEFPNIGEIPDFDKKIATVRSRDINISIIFQSIGQLSERYPGKIWTSIIGNCDTQIMLGCNDEETAKFISNRSGETTVKVATLQHPKFESFFTLGHKHSSGDGKRKIFNPDEILRLPNNEEIIVLRGKDVWKAYKYDFSLHPESKKFRDVSIWERPDIDDVEGRAKYAKEDQRAIDEFYRKNKIKTPSDEFIDYKSQTKDKQIKEGADVELENDNYKELDVEVLSEDDFEIVDSRPEPKPKPSTSETQTHKKQSQPLDPFIKNVNNRRPNDTQRSNGIPNNKRRDDF